MIVTRMGALAIAIALAVGGCSPGATSARPVAEARTTGLDRALLDTALAEAAALPRLNSLIIARDGKVIAERSLDGRSLDTPVNIKSASKSVLAALAGVAVGRGAFSGVAQPVLPLLAGRVPAGADPRLAELTVDHLLSMRAGLRSTSGAGYGAWAASDDWVRSALGQPLVDEPGGRMIYSTGTSHILSAALTRAAGRSTLELARDWLGEPLGISVPAWSRDPQGTYFGGNDMLLSPRALLRFGELYRNDGLANGRRALPAGWVRQSWTPRGTSMWTGSGYGYGWWIGAARGYPIYYAWGYGGQMVYVVPGLGLTAVMTSDADSRGVDGHVQALHALVAERLIPAAERGAAG